MQEAKTKTETDSLGALTQLGRVRFAKAAPLAHYLNSQLPSTLIWRDRFAPVSEADTVSTENGELKRPQISLAVEETHLFSIGGKPWILFLTSAVDHAAVLHTSHGCGWGCLNPPAIAANNPD